METKKKKIMETGEVDTSKIELADLIEEETTSKLELHKKCPKCNAFDCIKKDENKMRCFNCGSALRESEILHKVKK